MNFNGLYSDWAHKQMSAANYRMDKIRKKRKKRTNLMLKVIIPASISFITIGAFTFAPFFRLAYLICCFIIAVGISIMMCLDDKDNKKIMAILESWGNWTDDRFLPPSIKDT